MALRISRPWSFKAPFLISVPYYIIAVGGIGFRTALETILGSLVTIVGVAGVAYVINDFADRDVDAKADKPNFFAGRHAGVAGLYATVFLLAAIVPWLTVLPLTQHTGALLAVELALFLSYSLPPIRLKERGVLGALADALYAHAVPALLAGLTFASVGQVPLAELVPVLPVLVTWQLVVGLRNILIHQIADMDNDRKAGVRTWVACLGVPTAERVLGWMAVPLEMGLFAALLLLIAPVVPSVAIGLLVFVAYTSYTRHVRWRHPLPRDVRGFLFTYVDDFYAEWIPVLVLVQLAISDPAFLVLLALHLVMFRKNLVRRILDEARPAPAPDGA